MKTLQDLANQGYQGVYVNQLLLVFVLSLVVVMAATALTGNVEAEKERLTCATFDTQKQAQTLFDSDPDRYKGLDGSDKDGKPCEALP